MKETSDVGCLFSSAAPRFAVREAPRYRVDRAMTLLLIMLGATPLDLSALRTTTKVVILVKDRYAEPNKVTPKKMLREAVRRWASDFPEVKADLDRTTWSGPPEPRDDVHPRESCDTCHR